MWGNLVYSYSLILKKKGVGSIFLLSLGDQDLLARMALIAAAASDIDRDQAMVNGVGLARIHHATKPPSSAGEGGGITEHGNLPWDAIHS